jgi:hypothetical protein
VGQPFSCGKGAFSSSEKTVRSGKKKHGTSGKTPIPHPEKPPEAEGRKRKGISLRPPGAGQVLNAF